MLLLFSQAGWSQTAPAATATPGDSTQLLANLMTYILIGTGALLCIVAIFYLVNVNQFLFNKLMHLEDVKSGVVQPEAIAQVAAPAVDSFWTRLRKKYWEDAVPIEREADIMLGHAYDGIRELDNRLPPWWVNMFVITIVWAFGYMYFYHWGGNGPSAAEAYNMDMEAAKKEKALNLASKANAVDESSVIALTDVAALGEGATIFKTLCAACHGQNGEGTVGPNFTDEYWIHGGGIKNVFKTIKYGVPEKGMISWEAQLKPVDMQKVGSYILTLNGANPPNPKAPQGTIWQEDVTAPASGAKEAGMK